MLNPVATTGVYHEIRHVTKLGRFALQQVCPRPTVTTAQHAVLLAYQGSNNLIIMIMVVILIPLETANLIKCKNDALKSYQTN
jgi:hypothetical protein